MPDGLLPLPAAPADFHQSLAAGAAPVFVPDLDSYDVIIVAYSAGKDSLACVLYLLALGVDPAKIELWHHDVDGREGSTLMDWPCTRSYTRKTAEALGLKLYFSWKVNGFEGEMLRDASATAPVRFETPEGDVVQVGGNSGKLGTRRMFPQQAASLAVRWCSAYLKVDVGAAAINNQDRFLGQRVLFVSGERAEESASRAKYEVFEPHRTDNRDGARRRRHVDHWRAVHGWSEQRVWDIIRAWGVVPHPAYRLGWARVSCSACIFGSANQWASLLAINPDQVHTIARFEGDFGKTIHRKMKVLELAMKGRAYPMDPEIVRLALSEDYDGPVLVDPALWRMPAGAFGENAGPC